MYAVFQLGHHPSPTKSDDIFSYIIKRPIQMETFLPTTLSNVNKSMQYLNSEYRQEHKGLVMFDI